MKRLQIGNGILAPLFLILLLTLTRGSRAEDKTVLVRPFKPGVSVIYKTVILTNAQGADVRLESSAKQYVKEIKDNGQVVVITEDQGGKTILNGQAQEQKPSPPASETRDKLGKLVDFAPDDQQPGLLAPEVRKLLLILHDVFLTAMPVKAGDTWETVLDNPATKDAKITAKTTYQGMEKVDGVDCWKFKQTADAVTDTNGAKMSEEFTAWVSPTDGLLQKLDAKTKDVPTQFGPLTFNISLKRVPDDKKPAPKDEKK